MANTPFRLQVVVYVIARLHVTGTGSWETL